MRKSGEFELYPELPILPQYKIILKLPYDTLKEFCQTSKGLRMGLCSDNAFWKQKTYYDFGDLYDIEFFDGNWRDIYEYHRALFTLTLIEDLEKEDKVQIYKKLAINRVRRFLDPNGQNEKETTALIQAAKLGYIDIVRELLELGADPDIQDKWGNTALIYAYWERDLDIAQKLLEAGADVDVQNEFGVTALMRASGLGHISIVQSLLKNEADPNIRMGGEDGRTALDFAEEWDEIVDILRDVV